MVKVKVEVGGALYSRLERESERSGIPIHHLILHYAVLGMKAYDGMGIKSVMDNSLGNERKDLQDERLEG